MARGVFMTEPLFLLLKNVLIMLQNRRRTEEEEKVLCLLKAPQIPFDLLGGENSTLSD